MRGRPVSRIALGLVAGAFSAALVAAAAADYRQSYLDGLDALRRGDLELAVGAFEEAIAERPTERPRARLVGAIPQPYLPHHYLGVALFRLGRCEAAVAEWSLSAAHGAVDASPELAAEALDGRERCELLDRAETALMTAERAAAEMSSAERRLFEGDLEARRRGLLRALAASRETLVAGRRERDFEHVGAALAEADRVGRELTDVDREARRQWEERAASQRPAHAAAERADLDPPPAASAADAASSVAPAGAPAAPAPPPRRDDRPSEPTAPPGAVRAAIEAFFAGDYPRTTELLDPLGEPSTRRGALLVPLFRAAALYALFLTGGEAEPELYERALAEIATCHRVAPGFRPEPAHFSPRFVELYGRRSAAE